MDVITHPTIITLLATVEVAVIVVIVVKIGTATLIPDRITLLQEALRLLALIPDRLEGRRMAIIVLGLLLIRTIPEDLLLRLMVVVVEAPVEETLMIIAHIIIHQTILILIIEIAAHTRLILLEDIILGLLLLTHQQVTGVAIIVEKIQSVPLLYSSNTNLHSLNNKDPFILHRPLQPLIHLDI